MTKRNRVQCFYVFLNNFYPEDDPLPSKHVAKINITDILVMLTVFCSFNWQAYNFYLCNVSHCRSHWPSCLRRGSAAARLLRLSVRIPPGAWMFVSCECCVLSGRGLCDELITRPEESYRLWCFVVCDLEASWMRRPWPALGRSATGKEKCVSFVISFKDWLAASRFGLRHLW